MGIGTGTIGRDGIGGPHIGGPTLTSMYDADDYIRITTPAAGAILTDSSFWSTSASQGPVEASLDGVSWIIAGSGLFSDFGAQWTVIVGGSPVTLRVRIQALPGIEDSVIYTKSVGTERVTTGGAVRVTTGGNIRVTT